MQDIFFLESFAGNAEASRVVQSQYPDRVVTAMDIKYTENFDLNSNSGMGFLVSKCGKLQV